MISRAIGVLALVLFISSCSDNAPFGDTENSFRGLSTPNDSTIWAVGANGFWAVSADYGVTWDTGHVSGFYGEFRDVHSWDENTAIAMGISTPGVLFKTVDSGKNWKEVYRFEHPQAFFDNMDFNQMGSGVVIGDPIDGKWTIIGTNDYGDNWVKWHPTVSYDALKGDVAFAASGSGLIVDDQRITFFTGGSRSAVYSSDRYLNMELARDTGNSFGVYSAVLLTNGNFAFVGGDYRAKDERRFSAGILDISGALPKVKWATEPPQGYRSCIIQLTDKRLLCCGPNGIDISKDGFTWEKLSTTGYHVISQSVGGKRVWAAGSNGRLQEITSLLPRVE